ncbi:hypothetical protein [Chryseobacterium balustinum]|uniref:Uncharacterized protein n=1 Tax=Chryseobacterium balustinum TaxID=246 RepID=A0AAX2IQF7_9FLAO|nr:hypothetical protein [Chryseobacterium balustinum]AZB28284.1 hypothetical protein EB354_02860 [Chryseobacterium balustinum]SKB89880.1 hypothetical protein SAMN05421800_11345 [Chryseobacterium balustinum]SQA92284.1 Uncharacterised protein [Chryseobacterium balustinum]
MKILVLILTVLSSCFFAQQKRNFSLDIKDSLAVKNVNSILDYSKKSFSNLNSDLSSSSEVNKNLDQLLINTINFNTVINNRSVTPTDAGTFYKPRVDAMDMLGRKVLSLQVYKSK